MKKYLTSIILVFSPLLLLAAQPNITAVSIPDTAMKIGDVVTATITVATDSDDYTTGSGGVSGNIDNFAISGLSKINDTTYTATFTIVDGGSDVASGTDIPLSITLTDSAGTVGNTFTTAISQANDSIDANLPTLTSSTPADNATNVAIADNIVLTFSEDIAVATGNIDIYNVDTSTIVESIDVTTLTPSGAVLTINPSSDLSNNTNYAIKIAPTAIDDLSGNSYAGISDSSTLNFTTIADQIPPTLTSTTPADNATGIAINSTITLNFSEDIAVGTGSIEIYNVTDGVSVETFDVSTLIPSANTLSLTPTSNFLNSKEYAVRIATTAIKDLVGNEYAGITDTSTINFTTVAETTPPTLTSSTPADNATNVAIADNIVLTFSEDIAVATGNIDIYNVDTSTIVESIDVTTLTPSGAVLTINPSSDLSNNTNYAIKIAPTAIDDLSGNSYAGISDSSTLNFTTIADPNVTDTDNDGYYDAQETIANTSLENNQSKPNTNDVNKNAKNDIVFFDVQSGKLYYSEFNPSLNYFDVNETLLASGDIGRYPVSIFDSISSNTNKSVLLISDYSADVKIFDGSTIDNLVSDFDKSQESLIGSGDYNDDGKGSFFSFKNNNIYVFDKNSSGGYSRSKTISTGLSGYEVKVSGDLTHDGKIDFAMINSAGEVKILEENDATYAIDKNASAYLRLIGVSDYSGDGQDDLVFTDIRNNDLHIWEIVAGNPLHVSTTHIVATHNEQTVFPMGSKRFENDFDESTRDYATLLNFGDTYKAIMTNRDSDMFKIVLSTSKKINIYSEVSDETVGLDLSARLISDDGSIYLLSSDADMSNNRNFQIVTDSALDAGNYYLEVFNESNDTSSVTEGYYIIHTEEAGACSSLDNPDSDGDGICDMQDNAPNYNNPSQVDADSDGFGDCVSQYAQNCDDRDFDGPLGDPDGDNVLNYIDTDDDNDGISDVNETHYGLDSYVAQTDTDGDGYSDIFEIENGYSPTIGATGSQSALQSVVLSSSTIKDSDVGNEFDIALSYNYDMTTQNFSLVFDKSLSGTLVVQNTTLSDNNKTITVAYAIEDKNVTIDNIGFSVNATDSTGRAVESSRSDKFSIDTNSTGITPSLIMYLLN